ncbi:hypothetical protein HLH12_04525 [Acinetobacter sp. NIPH 2377]|uniref:hypothetical protein n=1 Tax=Acinetobacter terrestris TaxID=2529843 RepID=UPI00148FD93B|nr:hypothetical protein [Acinetobacter terrestris]NNH34841.1 hypothetical protein [Acinetobacter terrestris]
MKIQKQTGSALIVILVVVMVLSVIGVMAIRSGIIGLSIATNSQAAHIMDQNNDAALFKIEDSSQFGEFLIGTGLFGYPKMESNRDKELVICYRGNSKDFYQFYNASLVYENKSSLISNDKDETNYKKPIVEDIGGAERSGFCQIGDGKHDYVSGRSAAMTQIAVRVSSVAVDGNEPFSHYQEGTDTETGKLDEAVRLVVTTTTLMPVLSSQSEDTVNGCMENLSYVDEASSLETVSECLSRNAIPYKTQVSEYSLGQFIKKVKDVGASL